METKVAEGNQYLKTRTVVVYREIMNTKKEPEKASEVVLPLWMEKAERLWGCELREKQVQVRGSGQPESTRPSLASHFKSKTAD